jgi:sodium-dependent dicarboxylate transporter 2/3/5
MGRSLLAWMPSSGDTALLIGSTVIAAALSEVTSNTASANMIVPVVISVAQAAGADPLAPALGATMGASMGFMLPVSTPCNAIVYGSGRIPLVKMMRYGFMLDIVGVLVIITAVKVLLPLIR